MDQIDAAGWRGALDIDAPAEGQRPSRSLSAHRALHPASLLARLDQAAGVRLRFGTEATTLRGRFALGHSDVDIDRPACASVSIDDATPAPVPLAADGSFELTSLTPDRKVIELWFPHDRSAALTDLSGDAAALPLEVTTSRTWAMYGSSITHGLHTSHPAATWPAVAARLLGADHYNLGVGGEAHLDPLMALSIADVSPDAVAVCAGINIHNADSMNLRVLHSAVAGFVAVLRRHHPATPIVVISPIHSPSREHAPSGPRLAPPPVRRALARISAPLLRRRPVAGAFGPTLAEIRDTVHQVTHSLIEAGDTHLTLIDGRDLLGPSDAHLLPDGLHPGDEGAHLIASRFAESVADVI